MLIIQKGSLRNGISIIFSLNVIQTQAMLVDILLVVSQVHFFVLRIFNKTEEISAF
jgi:hypothetical protein